MRSWLVGETARAVIVLTLLFALAVPFSASAQQEAEGTPAPLNIPMQASQFVPQAAVVVVNQSVNWINQDGFKHDVTSVEEGVFTSPRDMGQGANFTHTFDKAGVYDYVCTIHSTGRGNGMWGRIIVVQSEPTVVPGGAGHGPSPESFGVRWLAHWVGIISFVAVIAVLMIYYFVLKYGETVHATDHRDRKEK